MKTTTQMEIKVSGGRIFDAKTNVMPNGTCKLTMNVEVTENPSLILPDKKIILPERKIVIPKELERRIDPLAFPMDADWMQYEPKPYRQREPKAHRQREIKYLFLDAKIKGRLHSFTCMAIDVSYDEETGKLIYKKGLPPAVGHSNRWWVDMFKNYAPDRNSRQMTKTEYACKCLFLIWKLVEEKNWEIEKAWDAVCEDSIELGHYCNSDNPKYDFEPTGSREVCGFYDLVNVYKMLAEDPWEEADGFWAASGSCNYQSGFVPLADLFHRSDVDNDNYCGLGILAMDTEKAA